MAFNRKLTFLLILLLFIVWVQEPVGRNTAAIDVADGTVTDWVGVPVALSDPIGDSPNDMTDLTFVAFDFDDTWFYVRWDIDNDTTSPAVLYDMGINTTATGITWDMYVSAQIELIGGIPEITNISIRDADDVHVWNATDDGNMTEDGSLYLDPAPGSTPGNHSTEARFPLVSIGIPRGVIFGQFRSHASTSVNSAVKDQVPDSGYIVLSIDKNPPGLGNLNDDPDPQDAGGNVNITVDVTDDFGVNAVKVNITYPNGSWVNTSMIPGSGVQWFSNLTYGLPGMYTYTVWANDSSSNWNSTGPGTFVILDIEPPEIITLNDSPDPQENGGNVNITAEIIDNVDIAEVWLNISHPNGSTINVSMTNWAGDDWFFNTNYDYLGVYFYTLWVMDLGGNWNTTSPEDFTIIDTDPPEFFNLDDLPDPQDRGGAVNITVDVVDDVSVDSVWVNITHPDSSWMNTSMSLGNGDNWFYEFIYNTLGTYSYWVWANDTSNNQNSSGFGIFAIQNIGLPELDNVTASPDPQENGGEINITVDVWDPDGVDEVWLNITFPNGSSINVSMNSGGGINWFYNTTYDDIDVHSFTIWANDISGKWNSTNSETFTIIDTDAPELLNAADSPDPQENGGSVNITAQVIDDVGVSEVWVAVIYPDSSVANNSMAAGVGDEWFFITPYDILGVHSYIVWARDVAGNWNATSPQTFTIIDTDPPEFMNLLDAPDPQENGGTVAITVDIIDDVDVTEVWINITYPDGSGTNTSMTDGPNDQYSFNSPYTILGSYHYEIWTVDTSGNWNKTIPRDFVIRDTDSPDIGEPDTTPEEQEEGGDVNITVDVTDDVGTEEVWVDIILPDGTSLNVSMTKGEDDEWYFDDTFDSPGNYSYTIWAADDSGNWNSRGPESFSIVTPEPPEPPEELEEEPDLLHMIILLIFWPLFLILLTILVVRLYAFDSRFKRHLNKKAPEFIRNFEAMHSYSSDSNRQVIQEIMHLCFKAGIPVEEFILALQGAWSSGQIDAAQAGFLNNDIAAIFNSIDVGFDRIKRP